MVTNCFYHPKVEGANTCRRCMIPLCEECTAERYCPECHKMAMYVRDGQSGRRKANLVVEDNERRASLTKQLMINRLANNVLSELPAAAPAVRKAATASRRPAPKGRKPAGSHLVSLAVTGLALVCAFSLGSFFSRPAATAAEGRVSQVAEVLHATHPSSEDYIPVANRPEALATTRIADYSPRSADMAYAHPGASASSRHHEAGKATAVSGRFAEAGLVPALPRAPRGYASLGHSTGQAPEHRQAFAAPAYAEAEPTAVLVPDLPAVPSAYQHAAPAAHPVRAAAPKPSLALTWPVAGNTLRMTSYVKVNVANPGQVSVLNVTVNGRTVAPLASVGSRNEIPVDTTQLANGDHRLQVMAMTESGDIVASEPVTVTVSN